MNTSKITNNTMISWSVMLGVNPGYDNTAHLTLVSTILYVSWSIFAINIGMANASMSLDGFPFVRSFMYVYPRIFQNIFINILADKF